MKTKILKHIKGIKWSHNEDGGAYYKDVNGVDWYQQRNALPEGKIVVVVDSATNLVMVVIDSEPGKISLPVPLLCESVDVYQLECDMTTKKFESSYWNFENGQFVEVIKRNTPEENKTIQSQIIAECNTNIDILRDKVEYNLASDEDKKLLDIIKMYRIAVYDLDMANPTWPIKPF
ncbi:hypothetical protein BN80_255 [Yersinia phage phiR1-RT]|uniref:Tail fiber assembly protein n=1 Tax=Yersinia phage phiR1-RT TaxID=1206558 RepID=I7KRG5_BPPR1|nr:tail fiber assembly protein [Yersinia phage phiR1-RT]CCI88825.1 hypothetical protein BN80_255 [Yersinia phage phiR1-RT]